MKYFCISDIHGEYDKMITALNNAGFNKETDTLISLGDLFDRGEKSKEVLEFVMSCPHRLLCMGNHDLRLMQLIKNPYLYNRYDYENGVIDTLNSFIPNNINTWSRLTSMRDIGLLKQYFYECKAAFEFSNLIITHAWIPVLDAMGGQYKPFKCLTPDGKEGDWHNAYYFTWEDALWANTDKMVTQHLFPEKPLLIGHWHAWRLAEKYGEKRRDDTNSKSPQIDCSSFTYEYHNQIKFIAIDGCTNWYKGGQVNVYCFETDEEPTFVFGGLGKWYY